MTLDRPDMTLPGGNSARSAFERVSQSLHLKAATKQREQTCHEDYSTLDHQKHIGITVWFWNTGNSCKINTIAPNT
jgi:hypothetical protein